MFRSLLRNIASHKSLRALNREMRFEEVKNLYENLYIKDPEEKILCQEQYYYAIKFLSILEEEKTSENAYIQKSPIILDMDSQDQITQDARESLLSLGIFISFYYLYDKMSTKRKGKSENPFDSIIGSKEHIHYVENSNVTFNDVKGIDDCREEIEDVVDFLKHPGKYIDSGARMTKGVLLTGNPGTGKTLLAKAIAGEAGVRFYYCSGSEFDEMFLGLGAKRIRSLFKKAKKNAPCIIFIDEIDCVAKNRSSSLDSSDSQILNQLLIELDGFEPSDGVIVIGATNFPESIDPAIKRSGRFDKEIYVPVPDLKGRTEILELYLAKIKKDSSINAHDIAQKTIGMTGAELANIVNLAAINAVKYERTICNVDDFEQAIDRIKIGLTVKTYSMTDDERNCTVYHELGHAIVGYYTQGAGNIHKVTILPRGQSLGHTSILDKKEHNDRTKEELLAIIDVCMGGRAAEEIFFGPDQISFGCSSDLNNATQLVYHALKTGIFTEIAGFTSYHDYSTLGDDKRNQIDKIASKILDSSYNRAKDLIRAKINVIEKLAGELKVRETLNKEEFIKIVNS